MSELSQSPSFNSPSNLDRITTPIDVLKDVFKEGASPNEAKFAQEREETKLDLNINEMDMTQIKTNEK